MYLWQSSADCLSRDLKVNQRIMIKVIRGMRVCGRKQVKKRTDAVQCGGLKNIEHDIVRLYKQALRIPLCAYEPILHEIVRAAYMSTASALRPAALRLFARLNMT